MTDCTFPPRNYPPNVDYLGSMSHEQIPQIWTRAITRYERITEKALDLASLRELTTVEELLGSIETENKAFGDFRAKRSHIFSALKSAMLPIQLVGVLASTGAQITFPPAGLIFSAVKYLVNAAGGVSAKYDAIVDLMGTLKDFTVRLGVYAKQLISDALRDKLTDILSTMLEIFAIARHQIERGRLRTFGKNVLLGNDEGKAMIDKLNALMDSERNLTGAETLTEVKVANTRIKRVHSNIEKLVQHMNNMGLSQMQTEQAQEKRNRDHVKRVLQPTTSADDRYTAINRSRTQGTGDWIREEKVFQDWLSRVKPLLWVTGTPGAGKTYLASNIITYLKQRFPQNVQHPSHVSVAYFFFKDDDLKTRYLHQALRDISFQIAQNDPMYTKHIVSCVDSREDIATLPSLWQKLYAEFFLANNALDSSVYIILDALDEAFTEDRLELFEMLKDIQQGGRLQFLMLGRPHIDEEIDQIVEALAGPAIYVSELNNSEDIVRYIKSSISKSVYLKRASKALQLEIVDRLSAGAQGMFIWVDFMLKELLKKRDEGSMRRALDEAPNGLSQMIRHVLKDISESLKNSPQYAEDLNEMLAWATCSTSPLRLDEMESVVKWRSESGDGWIWLEGDLRRQYASLFLLNRKDGLTTSELQRRAIYMGQSDTHDSEIGFEDLDNLPDFNSDPKTTYVTLTHASLGDFFRSEWNSPISADGCPPIGVSFHEAKVMLFKRYYEIISCPEDSSRSDIANLLLFRASSSVIPALKAMDIHMCCKADKQTIGIYLARLLFDEWAMPRFVMFTGNVPLLEDIRDLFLTWLSNSDVQEALPPVGKGWYDSFASGDSNNIFLPAIRYIARSWLGDAASTSNGHNICKFVHDYLHARGISGVKSIESAEVVVETAEWCGFEKTAIWHRRLAMALRDLGFLDECIEYFQKAIQLGSTADGWLTRAEMATAYIRKKEYRKAAEAQEICMQLLDKDEQPFPNDSHKSHGQVHRVLESLGLCYNQLGEFEKGLSLYRKAFGYNNRCNTCVRAILAYLNMEGRYTESMDLLQEMDEKIPETDFTRLSECLMTNCELSDAFTHWFSAAAYHTSNTAYMVNAYASAAKVAFRKAKTVQAANLELCRGVFLQIYEHDSSRAARVWEGLINTYCGKRSDGEISPVLETASNFLATHYLTQAMEVGVDTVEGRRYGEMLELLAQGRALYVSDITNPQEPEKNPPHADWFVTNSEVGLIMGNYYRLSDRNIEAMACYTAQVKECIRLLSDNDPLNDGMAFRRLGGVLAGVGDKEDAVTMWHQSYSLAKYDDDSNGENEELAEQSIICRGCHRSVEISNISICRYCHNVIFCVTCLQLRRSGSLAVNICSQKHDWILLPPLPKSLRQRDKGQKDMVFVEDHWIRLDELKHKLMLKWGIK
ncbi:tetratricopeptide repeat domain protein [Aspergillus udagawae]|uniref:Tetratricopeptide repeat domain protein n=1 Tax=Aspergillus udagawae TaxID=91492 RepID=A0ABQ1B8P1_9EURO|nr:tetratricopeptide repeat domain protein [Aspergillus udagawae]